jgi:hypothetical protein
MSEDTRGVRSILDGDEVREVLRETFYEPEPKKARRRSTKKADHYEIICISLYQEDLARLDAKVELLKKRGHRKMSRSALIRFALDTADLDALPRSY